MFKMLILLLFASAVVSLGFALHALLRGNRGPVLTRSLWLRLLFCGLILLVLLIGLWTGAIQYGAPWSGLAR